MAVSGTFAYDAALDELITESWERAGMDATAVGAAHLKSVFRSIKQILNSEWVGIGERRWMVQQFTHTTVAAETYFALSAGVVDILEMVLRRNSRDTEMYPISRDEYLTIVDKNIQGRPDRFYVDRNYQPNRCYYWQAGANATDILVYNAFRNNQDPGVMQNTLQMPALAHDAFCEGLAARIAQKFNYERYPSLQNSYRGDDPNRIGGKLKAMREADRDRSDLEVYPSYGPPTTRR